MGPVASSWGDFARGIPGRVGYQCASFYKKLVQEGVIEDKRYFFDENHKARFINKRNQPARRFVLGPVQMEVNDNNHKRKKPKTKNPL